MSWAYDGRCTVCGGRGHYPISIYLWVPEMQCPRCEGTGFDPAAATFTQALGGLE